MTPAVEDAATVAPASALEFEGGGEPVPAPELAAEPAREPESTPAPATSFNSASIAEVAPDVTLAPVAEIAPEDESARSSEPHDPVSEPTRAVSFDTCFAKAQALKGKGVLSVAARLFRECADRAPEESQGRRARFEALACYVKAGMADQARLLCGELDARRDELTPAERIKLDAVARMM